MTDTRVSVLGGPKVVGVTELPLRRAAGEGARLGGFPAVGLVLRRRASCDLPRTGRESIVGCWASSHEVIDTIPPAAARTRANGTK